MKKQSLAKNFIFQFLYQVVVLIIPLILSPYLTRTLGSKSIGVYSYANSIAYYFVIFAMLGISRHGQRIIASSKDNDIELRKCFWSLFILHVVISGIVLVCYYVTIVIVHPQYYWVYIIEGIYVASALFDITWFFYGLENFQSVVTKNIIIKVLECTLIILLVKDSSDILLYTLITAFAMLIGQAVMIPQAVRIVRPIKFDKSYYKMHIKPLFVFFVSVLATSLYTVFDKTLLGIMSTKENVAFYEYSNKIINVPKTITNVIGTVMFPRACRLAANGDVQGQKKYINYSMILTSFISMASIFGLLAIADEFAVYYFGAEFAICGTVMICLSFLIYIVGMGDIIRTQYMIPNHMDRQFTISLILNAVVNLILTITLIPVLGIYGAIIGTVSAEICGFIYQMYLCREFVKIRQLISTTSPFVIIGCVMLFSLLFLKKVFSDGIIDLIALIVIGGVEYCVLSAVYLYLFQRDLFYFAVNRIPVLKKFIK